MPVFRGFPWILNGRKNHIPQGRFQVVLVWKIRRLYHIQKFLDLFRLVLPEIDPGQCFIIRHLAGSIADGQKVGADGVV